jgi:hypothetical protein
MDAPRHERFYARCRSGTADIADAHVVVCARRGAQAIVTSDPRAVRRLDPAAVLVVI